MEYCKHDISIIVWSMSCDHFNYVDLIHIFEDYNGLNITVITKIMTVVTSQTLVIWMCFYLHRIVM